MRKSKHSKAYRMRSQGSKDKRPRNQMSLDRAESRAAYERRDIAQKPVSKSEQRAANQAKLDGLHGSMKPIRAAGMPNESKQ